MKISFDSALLKNLNVLCVNSKIVTSKLSQLSHRLHVNYTFEILNQLQKCQSKHYCK